MEENMNVSFDFFDQDLVQRVIDFNELSRSPISQMYEYEAQFLFSANGLFIHHVLVNLMNNNLLKLPTEEESKSLISLILTNTDN